MVVRPAVKNEPYCGNCGYRLTGATESSKCPECGRPLVEVLTRNSQTFTLGKRYRSKAALFGWPVIDIAIGPANGEIRGKAKGIIAIGDLAIGGVAMGGLSCGIVALGGMSIGLFALGGLAVGLLTALGGMAIGALAVGGGAIGILATGGGAVGVYAQGGGVTGMFTRGPQFYRMRRIPGAPDPFESVSWFFGPSAISPQAMLLPAGIIIGCTLAAAAAIGLTAWLKIIRTPGAAATATEP